VVAGLVVGQMIRNADPRTKRTIVGQPHVKFLPKQGYGWKLACPAEFRESIAEHYKQGNCYYRPSPLRIVQDAYHGFAVISPKRKLSANSDKAS
jgi:hypothetical protein